jgi:hypothetical protein
VAHDCVTGSSFTETHFTLFAWQADNSASQPPFSSAKHASRGLPAYPGQFPLNEPLTLMQYQHPGETPIMPGMAEPAAGLVPPDWQ